MKEEYNKINTPQELHKFMNNIEYGYVGSNQKIYKYGDENFDKDWYKNYTLETAEDVVKNQIGNCWDQVELERDWFLSHNYEMKTYFEMVKLDYQNDYPSHTFLVYKDNDKYYWFEHADYNNSGIHEYNNLKELHEDQMNKYHETLKEYNISSEELKHIVIKEYTKPKSNISAKEFINHCLKPKKKAIIFDMDGTMFDTEPLWEKAFIRTGKELGYPFTKELHDKTISSNRAGLTRILKQELGEDFPVEDFIDKYVKNMELTIREDGLPTKKGLIELLNYLKDNDYTIAIASSSDLEAILRNLKITNIDENIFKIIVSGDHFTRGKPDPEIFLVACHLLKVDSHDAIVIEDSNAGIKAAYRAGCIPILIPDVDQITKETRSMTKYEFNSLLEVIDLLDNKK